MASSYLNPIAGNPTAGDPSPAQRSRWAGLFLCTESMPQEMDCVKAFLKVVSTRTRRCWTDDREIV